jgi:hypothetical protein
MAEAGTRGRTGRRRGPSGGAAGAAALAVLVSVVVAAVLVVLGLGLVTPSDAAPPGPLPVLAPPTGATGRPVDGITSDGTEQLAFHVHAHLRIYVDGQQREVPPGIGVAPPLQVRQTPDGPLVVGGAGFYWLHTHDGRGVVHIESPVPRRFTLGELFDVWGQPLGPDRVGPAHGPVTALVGGVAVGGDPRDIRLDAHTDIQLDVGTIVASRPYTFPPSL